MADPIHLNPSETIIIKRRHHWVSVAPIVLSCFILILVLPVAGYFYGKYSASIHKLVDPIIISSLTGIYMMLVVAIFLLSIWIYSQNRIVLTNHHLVEYSRHSLFSHSISQFSLIKLQDVSSAQNGVWANLLGYGTITVQTAGEEDNFVFKQIPQPQDLANAIMQAHEALESSPAKETKSV